MKIFISHAASDADLALCLKEKITECFGNADVFCSSDPQDLLPGSTWPKDIQEALTNAEIFLLLATSRSLNRPWVWFELGTFWFKNKTIIPICVGQARKNSLPSPINEKTALNIDEQKDMESLFGAFENAGCIKRSTLDSDSFVKAIIKVEKEKAEQFAKSEGWIGVEFNGKFLSYDSPIEGLKLIEDGFFNKDISKTLTDAGYKIYLSNAENLSKHSNKGYHVILITDKKSWRQRITQGKQILIAKPVSKDAK